MKININNQEVETEAQNLQQLSESLSLPSGGVAVAVNNRMIPRQKWGEYTLSEEDKVVIIQATCGG